MYSRALYTQRDAQVDAGPAGVGRATVRALVVTHNVNNLVHPTPTHDTPLGLTQTTTQLC